MRNPYASPHEPGTPQREPSPRPRWTRLALFAGALFLFVFGIGRIVDGVTSPVAYSLVPREWYTAAVCLALAVILGVMATRK